MEKNKILKYPCGAAVRHWAQTVAKNEVIAFFVM